MNQNKSLDHRYRINIEIGMRVVIEEEQTSDLIPCYVKNIVTNAAKHESGIMVECENGSKGRVKYIGTETQYLSSMELFANLEKQLRKTIVEELSKNDPDWWENKIGDTIKDIINKKLSTGEEIREKLQIPKYHPIDETFFPQLFEIIQNKTNWNNYFEKIFIDKKSIIDKASELAPYRNLSAHNKDIPPHIEKKIKIYYDDIIHLIEEYRRAKTH